MTTDKVETWKTFPDLENLKFGAGFDKVSGQKDVSLLSDVQLNFKVAQIIGWRFTNHNWETAWHDDVGDGHPPDFVNSLDAMHEAEKFCFHPYSEFGARLFEQNLAAIVFPNRDINDIGDRAGEIAAMCHATARQRAEAFVKVMEEK